MSSEDLRGALAPEPVEDPKTIDLVETSGAEDEEDEEVPAVPEDPSQPSQSKSKKKKKSDAMSEEQRELKALKQARWATTDEINRQHFSAVGKEIPLEQLAWDTKREFGQLRLLDQAHVEKIQASLEIRPPREPIKVTTWHNEADRRMYLLAGQHVARAVWLARLKLEEGGYTLPKWCQVVRADVLAYSAPRSVRELVCGADNANSRVIRVTRVSECMQTLLMMKKQEPAAEVHKLVQKAVEHCGLNVDSVNAV